MARATSAASPGPGSGTRTCPRPSSVMSKIFGLTSEQRPWPWQRLASMDSGTCGPLSYHVRLHAFLHEHVDEATSSRAALSAWGQRTAGVRCDRVEGVTRLGPGWPWASGLVSGPGVRAWCPGLVSGPGVRAWCPGLVSGPGVRAWCPFLLARRVNPAPFITCRRRVRMRFAGSLTVHPLSCREPDAWRPTTCSGRGRDCWPACATRAAIPSSRQSSPNAKLSSPDRFVRPARC